MTTVLPPAGWYPDPSGSGKKRYWDGSAWTDRYQTATTGMEWSGLALGSDLARRIQLAREARRESTRGDSRARTSTTVSQREHTKESNWSRIAVLTFGAIVVLVGLFLLIALIVEGPDAELSEVFADQGG